MNNEKKIQGSTTNFEINDMGGGLSEKPTVKCKLAKTCECHEVHPYYSVKWQK